MAEQPEKPKRQRGGRKVTKADSERQRRQRGKPRARSAVKPVVHVEPWERQPGESDARYGTFLVYRDQPANGVLRRSLAKAAATVGRHPTNVEEWSREDHWRDRAAAWDRHNEAVRQAAMERRLEELGTTQANQLAAALQAASQPVLQYLQRVQRDMQRNVNMDHLSTEDLELRAIRAARVLPRLLVTQRLVHGLSTSNVDEHVHVDAAVAEARRQAEAMPRADQERFLAGESIEDGREADRERLADVDGTATELR